MKKLLISAMIAACLITTMAQAQTYNATGSERQAASNDMGMYQLTLEAFRKSNYYLNAYSRQSDSVRFAVDKVILANGLPALVGPTGQIVQYEVEQGGWFRMNEGMKILVGHLGKEGAGEMAGYQMTYAVSPESYGARIDFSKPIRSTSDVALEEFNEVSNWQRAIYLTFADIAQKSFSNIRMQKMNRQASVNYLTNQFNLHFADELSANFKKYDQIVMNSQMPGIPAKNSPLYCLDREAIVRCGGRNMGFSTTPNTNVVLRGFNEWSAIFPDGLVIKNSYGTTDVSKNGRPWFSESGIKGEKLSIAGSSDKGSSTSQKRGEQ